MPLQAQRLTAKPKAHAVIMQVPAKEWARIRSTGTWRKGCPGGRTTFRRIEVNFHGFDKKVHRGALIVNKDVASDVAKLMTTLFDQGFPIRRMHPIEDYRGDDNKSMKADNTSAMNCRKAGQSNAPAKDSPHANGRAIDINPWENPWVDPRCGCFRPDHAYGSQAHRPRSHHRQGVGGEGVPCPGLDLARDGEGPGLPALRHGLSVADTPALTHGKVGHALSPIGPVRPDGLRDRARLQQPRRTAAGRWDAGRGRRGARCRHHALRHGRHLWRAALPCEPAHPGC